MITITQRLNNCVNQIVRITDRASGAVVALGELQFACDSHESPGAVMTYIDSADGRHTMRVVTDAHKIEVFRE